MTPDGAGVLAENVEAGARQLLLVRHPNDPADPFREVKAVPEAEPETAKNCTASRARRCSRRWMKAPAPASSWSRSVNTAAESKNTSCAGAAKGRMDEREDRSAQLGGQQIRILGIGASSPTNAWLLAQVSSEQVALFQRRLEGGEEVWQSVALKSGGTPRRTHHRRGRTILTVPGAVHERVQTQVLTVTSQGVWIDGERPEVRASTTLFYRPESGGSGPAMTSWCNLEQAPPSAPACQHSLPLALPAGASRSIAWANGSTPYGERVITGFSEGVSLRLEGESFTTVLGLGGSGSHDQGGTYGAAFSNPREGWLGNYRLPVHLTLEPSSSRLSRWPVSFRHALTAAAAAPGQAVGSPSPAKHSRSATSERWRATRPARAGCRKAFWAPEGLRQTPRLRAVASPRHPGGSTPSGGPRPDVAVARGNGPVGTGPGRAIDFRGNLPSGLHRSERPRPRVCRRRERRAARLRQDLDPGSVSGGIAVPTLHIGEMHMGQRVILVDRLRRLRSDRGLPGPA